MNYVTKYTVFTIALGLFAQNMSAAQAGPRKEKIAGEAIRGRDAGEFFARGIRPALEDEAIVNPENSGLYGVFDGHGGIWVASYAKDYIVSKFRKSYAPGRSPFSLLVLTFDALEKEARKIFITRKDEKQAGNPFAAKAGSTAVVAYIPSKGGSLAVANTGDSRAVLIRGNNAIERTRDHKPNDEKEFKRLSKAGAADNVQGNRLYAAGVGLAVSRSLGDFALKDDLIAQGKPNALIATPDPYFWEYKPGDILVLACDGLWDVMENEAVASFVYANRARSAKTIAKFLGQEALRLGTTDNVTVVVVKL